MNQLDHKPMPATLTDIESELQKIADQRAGTDAVVAMEHVAKTNDIDRLMTGATLLNAFNYAVQRQAGRDVWTPADFKAFCISLSAMFAIEAEK